MFNVQLCRTPWTWGLVPRLVAAVGLAILFAGISQNALLALNGARQHSERHDRDVRETLAFLAPLVADQAIVGDYTAIRELLDTQAKRADIAELTWTDRRGVSLRAVEKAEQAHAPSWFTWLLPIAHVEATQDISAANSNYGRLHAVMNPIAASNLLWAQFVNQVQIVFFTVLVTVLVIWLIFRGNLRTLRMLAASANRFSGGDHTVRVDGNGAPEVALAAQAFNSMADSIQNLLESLRASERDNKRLAAIVKQSGEAIWTRDLERRITTWNASASALFGYSAEEAIGKALRLHSTSNDDDADRLARLKSGETLVYDVACRTKHGSHIELEIAAAPLHDENQSYIGTICVARDISERKRVQQELQAAREAKGAFDLVLMDCHMPRMDGFDATRRIRELQSTCGVRVPIIALIANAMQQDRDECMRAGMDDHLSKPLDYQNYRQFYSTAPAVLRQRL